MLIGTVRNEELIGVSLLLSPAAVRVNISVSRDSDDDDEWRLLSDYIFTPGYKSFYSLVPSDLNNVISADSDGKIRHEIMTHCCWKSRNA